MKSKDMNKINAYDAVVFLFFLSYVCFQTGWVRQTGLLLMKEDIVWYMGHKTSIDYIHLMVWVLASMFIYPVYVGGVFFLTYCAFVFFYSPSLGSLSREAAFLSMFTTYYIVFYLYVGLLSQSLCFIFFLLGWGFFERDRAPHMVACFVLGCMAHPALIPIFVLSLLLMGYYGIIPYLVLGFILTLFRNLNTVYLNLNFLNIQPYSYPWYFCLFIVLCPIMVLWGVKDRRYWVFMCLSFVLHNLRGAMFFIPFMVRGYYLGRWNRIDYIYITYMAVLTQTMVFADILSWFKINNYI
jgi:hypothetical protein